MRAGLPRAVRGETLAKMLTRYVANLRRCTHHVWPLIKFATNQRAVCSLPCIPPHDPRCTGGRIWRQVPSAV